MKEESRGPESVPAGQRAQDERETGSRSAERPIEGSAEGVLTLVCLTCGTEYYFTDERPTGGMTCEKCGGKVFRDFFSPEENDEAAQDFVDSTARDLDPDDAEGDARAGDVMDLNRD